MKSQAPESVWQTAVRLGAYGGTAAVLLALIGMVQTFQQRAIIGGVLTMGQAFLALAVGLSAFAAARRVQAEGPQATLMAGGLAGGVVGAFLALIILFISAVPSARTVLVNASPDLNAILTFGQAAVIGAVIWVGLGVVLGIVAAALLLLSPALRRAILAAIGAVLLIGLLADLLRLITGSWGGLAGLFTWIFSGKGLSVAGAVALVVLVVALSVLRERGVFARPAPARPVAVTRSQRLLRLGALVVVLCLLPLVLGPYMAEVFDQVGIFILMGLGLNIVVGFAGLLDLGYVGFFAIGAYVMGVLTSPELHAFNLSWWVALPFAVGLTVLAGVILGIPVLKVRGDYLAIITLGFGEIIRYLALSDALKGFTGGPQGIQLIAKPAIGGFVFNDQIKLYYLLLAACVLVGFIAIRLRDSRMGRAWMAMREDEDVAQAIGINLVNTKLLAFATGAAFAGLSGAIFAAKVGAVYPQSFGLIISINVLALIIIGGLGSIPGVIVGALVLVGLPELLREFAEFRLLVYGIVLVVMMLYRPEGLLPEAARRRELHSDEPEPIEAPADVPLPVKGAAPSGG
jgi:branched-chain amino acid transport system permease protein